ncbi:MAG: hypothetical protein AAFZ80_06860 [Cyanobacteria bacterium P01_A01_bin.105]
MATKPQVTRKVLQFGEDEADQRLLDAIATELAQKQYASFSHLCKAALHQFLLSREPTQSVILFMELERSVAQLQAQLDVQQTQTQTRLTQLEAQIAAGGMPTGQPTGEAPAVSNGTASPGPNTNGTLPATVPETPPEPKDPLLERLGGLLEDF